MTSRRFVSLAAALLLFPIFAFAGSSEVRVLFDVDNNSATGCTVGGMSGVDQILVTQVSDGDTGATVTQTHRLVCTSGIMGSPVDVNTTTWPAGWQSSSGQMLVETRIPFSALGSSSMPGQMRLAFDGTRGGSSFAALTKANGDPVLFPIPSHRRRAVGFPGDDRVIVMDGDGSDWGMIGALTEGTAGGGASAIKLIKVFAYANPLDSFVYFNFNLNLSNASITAVDDIYTRTQGQSFTQSAPGVLGNDLPVDLPLTAQKVSEPSDGLVTLNPDGSFTFTPFHPSSATTDTFQYKATSGDQESNVATVRIKVLIVNRPPKVTDTTFTVTENSPNGTVVGTVLVSDPDGGDQHTWTIVSGNTGNAFTINPATGEITIANASAIDFENDAQYTLIVKATDDGNPPASDNGSVTIDVVNANDLPVAVNDANTIAEDGSTTVAAPGVLANDTDQDVPHALTAVLVAGPAHAQTFALNSDGSYNYTPQADFNGTDSFTYRANDGTGDSNIATVTITVTAVNDAPSFTVGSNQTVNEDAGPQTVPNWISVMSAGPADEASQNLSFVIDTNDNTALFAVAPSVAPNGTLTYTPAADANGVANITLHIVDDGPAPGVNASAPQAFTITVNAVNDPPTFTLGANENVDEDTGLHTVAGFVTSVSVGPANESAQTITSYNVTNDNNALFSVQPAIATNGTLTYTLAADAFGVATVSVTATDSGGATSSPAQTFTITVNPVNDAPVLTAGGTLGYTENQAATAIDGTITLTDVDSANMAGATAQITGNYVNGEDVLSFVNASGITGSFNALTGTMTLSGSATRAQYETALRSVLYNNTSEDPSTATRTVTWQVNDGAATSNLSNMPTSSITVAAVNDQAVVNGLVDQTYTEDGPHVAIAPAAVVVDPDTANMTGALVTISGNADGPGNDILEFDTTGTSISGNFVPGSANLTFTGVDTKANYEQVLRSVKFYTISDTPVTAPRYIDYSVNDGSGLGPIHTNRINIIPVNDAPVVTAGGTLSYTENQAPTAIDGALTVTDADSANLTGATIQITSNYVNGEDVLSFANTANITGSFAAASGTLTLSGTDTVANYQTALRNVLYNNTSDDPSIASRTVTWQVNDGAGVNNLSNQPTSTINVAPVNDAPVLTAGATLTYTEGDPATAIDTTVTVNDLDGTTITGATVQITGNYANGQDVLSFATIGPISGVFAPATGTLTLSGTDTLANYQAALRTVKYNNTSTSPSALQRTVTWIATDGTTPSAGVTSSITVISINTAPTITAGGTLNYTENDAATAIDATITVTDPDTPNMIGATVQITGNYVNGQDVLGFTTQNGISGVFTPATGLMTLSGSSSAANYQTALRSVTYVNTSDNPSTASRTVSWRVDDGDSTNNLSNVATSTINVTAVNDAPVLTAGATLNYTENDPPTVIDATITATDPDNTTLTGATVQITGNYVNGEDVLAFATIGPISGVFTPATGTLTLSGTDSVANYQAALRTVTYTNPSNNPSTATRTVTWIATDGTTPSSGVTSTINFTSVNDAPVLTAGATLNYTENDPASVIDNTITAADADHANLTGATVQITGNYANGQDVLSFATIGAISGVFTPATGTLTLSGSDTVANYQAALRTVKYNNTSENPSTAARTVTWIATDGVTPSSGVTSTINVSAVNDAPVMVAGNTLNYTEDQPPSSASPALTLTDADSANITGATVQITGNYVNGEDVLAFATIGPISGSFVAGSGTLTLTGTDTVANYQAALRTVTYFNTSQNPSALSRTLTWIATDGALPSTGVTSTVSVTNVNDAPVATAGGTLNYTENDPATVIDNTITLADVDSVNLTGATVQITGNYQNGADVLSFANIGAITNGGFAAATGTLTLTGTDTIANYQAALRTVKYNNTSEGPTALARTVSWQVNDGAGINNLSNIPTSTINVTAVNDPPVVNANDLAYTEDAGAVVIDGTATVTDVDDASLPSATVQITANYVNGEDILAFTNAFGITGSFNASNGTLTLTGPASPANFQSALRTVTYQNTSNTPSTAPRSVTWTVNDDEPSSGTDTTTITVTATNDAPVLTLSGTLNYTEDDPATSLVSSATVTDADDTNIESATIQITTNYQNGQDVLSYATALGITGNFVAASGTLTLTGSASLASYQTALANVKYNNTSQAPATAARTVTWRVNDGDVNSNAQTSTINVTAVNDPPVNAPPTNPQSVNEDSPLTFTGAGNVISVSDPDAGSGNFDMRIRTTNGTTTIVTLSGTTVIAGTNGTADYTIRGTLAQVNTALGTLRFDPTLNFPGAAASGVATIQLTSNDNGNTPAPAQGDDDSFNITVNQVNDPPTAGNDAWDTFGNTELVVHGTPASTTPFVAVTSATGTTGNDSDPVEGNAFTVTSIVGCADVAAPYDCTVAGVGDVSMNADGTFRFKPANTIANGTPTDVTFQYVITDQPAAGTPLTATGTVTIHVYDRIWYVKEGGSGDGRSHSPLGTFTGINGAGGAGDSDGANDYIFVHRNGATAITSSIELEANQHLLGEGVGLSIPRAVNGGSNPTVLVAAGTKPPVTSAVNTVSIVNAVPVEIRGLDLTSSGNSLNAIDMTSTGALTGSATLTISDNTITTTGTTAEGVDINLNAGTSGTVSVAVRNNSVNTTGNGIDLLRNNAGTLQVTALDNNTISGNTGGAGISVVGTGASVLFDSDTGTGGYQTVSGGTTVIGASGNNVGGNGLTLSNIRGDLSFADLDVYSDATALFVLGTGSNFNAGTSTGTRISVSSGTPVLFANGGAAANITDANVNITPTTLTSTNSAGSGIALTRVGGAFTSPSGSSITNATSADVLVDGNSTATANVNLTYNGTITDDLGSLITITNVTAASTHSFTGAITDNDDGDGNGISLTGNSGATMSFSGGVVLSTGASNAFTATGGGTLVICDENPCSASGSHGALINKITTTTGTALTVNGTSIGTNDLEFRSISANGATKGISLNNTGTAAGNGKLIVSGTGTTDGTGGTIQNISARGAEFITTKGPVLNNMNFTNANNSTDGGGVGSCDDLNTTNCNAAIYLSGTSSTALDNLNITGTMVEEGINGINVAGFTLNNSTLSNCGNEVEEGCIKMRNLSGTAAITNSDLAFPGADVMEVVNSTGNLTLNVSNSIFRDSQSSAVGNTGLQVRAEGTSNTILNVTTSQFLRIRTVGLHATAINSGSNDVDVDQNSFDPGTGTMIGMDLDADHTGNLKFNVQNNTKVWSRNGPAINVFGDTNAVINGRINNNPDVQVKSNVGSNVGSGIRTNINKDAVANIEIKNNTVNVGSDDAGIDLSGIGKTSANPGGATKTLNATVTGNNVTIGATSTYGVIILSATNAGDTNAICVNVATNAITRNPSSIFSFRARVPSANGFFFMQNFVTNAEATWNANGNTPTSAGGSEVSFGGSGAFNTCTTTLPTNGGLDTD